MGHTQAQTEFLRKACQVYGGCQGKLHLLEDGQGYQTFKLTDQVALTLFNEQALSAPGGIQLNVHQNGTYASSITFHLENGIFERTFYAPDLAAIGILGGRPYIKAEHEGAVISKLEHSDNLLHRLMGEVLRQLLL